MNPNRSWLIKTKKEKNFKMIFFSIKRNVNISRKIREISLLRKIAYESNFFYACDKYCSLFIRVYVQERRNVATRETHTKVPSRRKSRKNIERWSLHKEEGKWKSGTSFVSSLFRIRDRAENVEALVEKLVISSKFDSIMKGKGKGEGKRGYSCYKKGK